MRNRSSAWLFLLAAFVLFPVSLLAAPQTAAAEDEGPDARFSSPRATMFTFLGAIHEVRSGRAAQWRTVNDCFDFEGAQITAGTETSREVARDLWGALNRIRMVTAEDLPDAEEAEGSFLFFPRPFDEDDQALVAEAGLGSERIEIAVGADGLWRFSVATVESAETLYEALKNFERVVDEDETALATAPALRQWMPGTLTGVAFLDIEAWQWLGLAALAFLGMLVDHTLRRFLRRVTGMLVQRFDTQIDEREVKGFVRPLGLLSSGVTWLLLFRFLGFPDAAEDILVAAIRTFTILAATWSAWRLADLVGELLMHRAADTESKFDDVLVPLVRKTFKTVVGAFGIIYAAQSLRINIVPLITGLGIGGLAFAFAAKDTIENFFGSVAVILDRPFEVGDWIVVDDVEGTVEELGFRSTRVRTFYNSQITVPNSTLVRATVDNFGRRKYRRWKTTLGVQYDTPPGKMLAFAEGIRELVRTHPYTRKDYFQVWFNGFGPSSIDLLLYVFHQVPDWSTELRERERLLLDIVRLADRLGVQFAFPTQTLHMFREEHSEHSPRLTRPEGLSERRSMVEGIRAARDLTSQQPWQGEKPPPVTYRASAERLDELGAEPDAADTTENTTSS